MNFNNTFNFSVNLPVFICSILKSFKTPGTLSLQQSTNPMEKNYTDSITTFWRPTLLSIIVMFHLSLFGTKSVIAQNSEKVIEKSEVLQFNKTSKQIVPVVGGESVKLIAKTG